MLILSGYSNERSNYYKENSHLKLSGWVLSPLVNLISIYESETFIGNAKVDIEHVNIWLAYNKIGNKVCGWYFEEQVKKFDSDKLVLRYYNDNELLFTQDITININTEKDLYLKNFELIKTPSFNPTKIKEELVSLGINVKTLDFDEKKYLDWFETIDYSNNFPEYCKEFNNDILLNTKALQHYISINLLEFNSNDVYVDIASSNSVCPDIIYNKHTKNIFRQDIRYPKGIHDNYIGSNAENIPLEEDSIDKMALHCSFEHFEDNSDINFINEADRILSVGSKFVITPLYLSEIEHILTSPSVWETKYGLGGFPKFTDDYKIVLNEKIQQRQEKFFSPESLLNEVIVPFKEKFSFEIFYMNEVKEPALNFYPRFTLVATKL